MTMNNFPHLKGFPARNLWDMRRLGEFVRSNRATATTCRRNSMGT